MGKMKDVFMETRERTMSIDDFDYQYQQWLAEKEKKLTDDFNKTNYLFVYGTLMTGYNNNYLLKNSKYIGDAKTMQSYLMTANGIPFVIKKTQQSVIHGELYRINSKESLKTIDWLEGHPDGYRREVIDIQVDDKQEKAWIYFYPEFNLQWMTIIKSGNYKDYAQKLNKFNERKK